MSTFRHHLAPSATFANRNRNVAPDFSRPVPFHATANRFPFHLVGAALVIIAAITFGVWAAHAAASIVAPLNAALASH